MATENIHGLDWRLNLLAFTEVERQVARNNLIEIISSWDPEIAKRIHYLISSSSRDCFYAGTSPFVEEYKTFQKANKWICKINYDLIYASFDTEKNKNYEVQYEHRAF